MVHRSHGTRGEVAPFLCAGGPQRIFQPEPQAPGVSGGWEPHGVGTATVADSSLDPGSTPQVPDVGGSGCFNYIYIFLHCFAVYGIPRTRKRSEINISGQMLAYLACCFANVYHVAWSLVWFISVVFAMFPALFGEVC